MHEEKRFSQKCDVCESWLADCEFPANGDCESFVERKGPDIVKCPNCGEDMLLSEYDTLMGDWTYKCKNCNTQMSTCRDGICSFEFNNTDHNLEFSGEADFRENRAGKPTGKIEIRIIMPPYYDYEDFGVLSDVIDTIEVDKKPEETQMIAYASAAFKVAKNLFERHNVEMIKKETDMLWGLYSQDLKTTSITKD